MRIHRFLRGSLAAAGTVLVVAACSGDDDTPAAGGSATPTAAPTTTASGPAGTPTASGTASAPTTPPTSGPPARASSVPSVAVSPLPPAPIGKDAPIQSGVAIAVAGVRDVQVKASGPGEIAGNGVQVTVRVRNDSAAAFDLSGLAVVASYGDDGTPANPSGSAETKALSGKLAARQTAEGTYYFLVPKAEAGSVRVEVSSSSSPSIAVFER